MTYLGNKSFMKNDILEIIHNARDILNIHEYYELFIGGCNIIEYVDIKNKHGNDLNKYLISFIEYIVKNGTDGLPTEYLDKQTYFDLVNNKKDVMDDWLYYWYKHFASFNTCEHGYGFIKEDLLEGYKKRLEKEVERLRTFTITNLDYREVKIDRPSIIYLDPPYKNTEGYLMLKNKFNHNEFYEYAIELSRKNFVLVSEYFMRKPFKSIKWVTKTYSVRRDHTNGEIEGLFLIEGGFGVKEYLNLINNIEADKKCF